MPFGSREGLARLRDDNLILRDFTSIPEAESLPFSKRCSSGSFPARFIGDKKRKGRKGREGAMLAKGT